MPTVKATPVQKKGSKRATKSSDSRGKKPASPVRTNSVGDFLISIGLERYKIAFAEEGYDTLKLVSQMYVHSNPISLTMTTLELHGRTHAFVLFIQESR